MSAGVLIALVFSTLTFICNGIGWAYFAATWKARMDYRVGFMWDKLFEPAMVRALRAGILIHESPLEINLSILDNNSGKLERLKQFYEQEGKDMDDAHLMNALERQFGPEYKETEKQTKIPWDAYLVAAAFYLRPTMSMFIEWNGQEWKNPRAEIKKNK